MKSFIEIEDISDEVYLINTDKILYIKKHDESQTTLCIISGNNQESKLIKGSYQSIKQLIESKNT